MTVVEDRGDPTLPAILEFQSPSIAITTAEVPRSARGIAYMITSFVGCIILALVLIRVDRVVTAQAVVVSKSPTLVVQPLDQSIVRSINVHVGQLVRSGEVLARLDPTFASADQGALAAQVASLQAQMSRLQAEADGRPFTYTGVDPDLSLQAAIFGQRKSEYDYKIENYAQKINSLGAAILKAKADVDGYRDRVALAVSVESMRKDLERLQVGSKLNTLAAMDNRAEMVRYMNDLQNAVNGSAARSGRGNRGARRLHSILACGHITATIGHWQQTFRRSRVLGQGAASPSTGRIARRPRRHRPVGREGFRGIRGAVGPRIHQVGPHRRAAGGRGQYRW